MTIGNSVTSIGSYAFYNCSSLTNVYYAGTESEWTEIDTGDLTTSTIYYYSETQPTDDGNYWYYDGDSNVAVW